MRSNSGLNGSAVGFVRRVDLMFASFVTSSSTLIGLATFRRDDDARELGDGGAGVGDDDVGRRQCG